jgi:hypothetical protein
VSDGRDTPYRVRCVRTLFLPDGWTLDQLRTAILAGSRVCAGEQTPGAWINVFEREDDSWVLAV